MTLRQARVRRLPRLIVAISGLLLIASLSLPGTASAEPYTVQNGDSLWKIAQRLDIPLSILRTLNEGIDPDLILPGQQLQTPDNSTRHGTGGVSPETYTVQENDTLSEIAHRLGIKLVVLRALNPEIVPEKLQPGTELSLSGMLEQQAVPAAVQPRPSSNLGIEHTVVPGDNATRIAEQYGLTLGDLRDANPSISLARIHPGQQIHVPVPDELIDAIDPNSVDAKLVTSYTISPGDNATLIAELHGTSLSNLRQLNPSRDLGRIFPGDTLTVPYVGEIVREPGTVAALPARYRTHVVEPGENLFGIADQYGISIAELRDLNPLRQGNLILIGERIRLPGVEPNPIVAADRIVESGDLLPYVAADLGVLPITLIANNPWLHPDQWVETGTSLRVPFREGLLVTVQSGNTLRGIAQYHEVELDTLLDDPGYGVENPNAIVVGQELIMPFPVPDFRWPVTGPITDPFGVCRNWDCSVRHRGLDLGVNMWEPIVAAADGLVTFVGGQRCCGLGLYVEIEHPDGWKTVYGHLEEFTVSLGQLIKQGESVGYNGNTGMSTGPHLHFEVYHLGNPIDPLTILP